MVQQVWEGQPSSFSWEQEGLNHIKNQLDQLPIPYYARQCFSFTAPNGAVRECDLLIAVPAGFYLLELKAHPGRARNSGSTWTFDGDKTRTIQNPLHATDLKSKELKGLLQKAVGRDNVDIPRLNPAVFLSAPDLVCEFDQFQRQNIYGRDGVSAQTKLGGVIADLLNRPPNPGRRPSQRLYEKLPELLRRIGVAEIRSERRIGQYRLEPKTLDFGPTWQDFLAHNTHTADDRPRRVRVYLTAKGATEEDRASMRRSAEREFQALTGIDHPGIVTAETIGSVEDLGPAVVFKHGKGWQRLTNFMDTDGKWRPLETRVEMVRQLADALRHAHDQRVFHRALSAHSVWVELDGDFPRLRIADWQGSARRGPERTGTSWKKVAAHIGVAAGAYIAPEAPNAEADPIQLDVFGLGALSYLILTGQEPAASREELGKRLKGGALVPSAVNDDMTPAIDTLVRGATSHHSNRFTDIRRFMRELDQVETELLSRYDEPVLDPFTAKPGDVVGGYKIEGVLGSGSTGRALLAEDTEGRFDRHSKVVLKVARADDDDAANALVGEAQLLRGMRGSHIVELLEGPIELGGRTVLVEAVAGEESLAQYLRSEGRLTADELKGWGRDLFGALRDLEDHEGGEVRHRDIKPDNLGVREGRNKKRRQLILFDFSLACLATSVPKDTKAGTRAYLDPFLGKGKRVRFDAAAEHYAAAVTLYEMATTELPSWGDGLTDPAELPATETVPQLRTDAFDPAIADGLKTFFLKALHRDANQRFLDLEEMETAFAAVFRAEVETKPAPKPKPAVKSKIAADLPLSQAGLSPKALAAAQDRLGVDTVGAFVEKPGTDITKLRGVGMRVRNELQQRAAEWRAVLNLAETAVSPATGGDSTGRATVDVIAAELVRVKGEEEYRRCVRLLVGLPEGNRPSPVPVWAPLDQVGHVAGLTLARITQYRNQARDGRWEKLASVNALRDLLPEILAEHGRVMSAARLSAAVLVRLGAGLTDPGARLAAAGAAVYAAVTVEDNKAEPRYVFKRQTDGTVIVALSGGEDPNQPTEGELIEYASELCLKARRLVADLGEADPLPQPAEAIAALRSVDAPDGLVLTDTDLVRLAADATRTVAVNDRLELYPTDLDPKRVVALTQLSAYLDDEAGVRWQDLIERVEARFSGLDSFPDNLPDLLGLLAECDLTVEEVKSGRLALTENMRSSTHKDRRTTTGSRADDGARFIASMEAATQAGGFRAVKVGVVSARDAAEWLSERPGVAAVDAQAVFLRLLREYVVERGNKPTWDTVLKADVVPPPGPFTNLLTEVWKRLEAELFEIEERQILFLHNATPLARYAGGQAVLHSLVKAARSPEQRPHGLWLLCPTDSLRQIAHLDGYNLGIIEPAGEQITLPAEVLTSRTETDGPEPTPEPGASK